MASDDENPMPPDSVIDSFAERVTCPICLGPRGNAPIEPVPPQKAGNNRPVRAFELMRVLSDPAYEGMVLRRGHGYFSLCEACNHTAGVRYVPPFVRWETAARANHGLAGTQIEGKFYLLRLIKGILMMFMSANTDLDDHHALREFVLDSEKVGLPAPYRLYAFSKQGPFKRATGTLSVFNHGEWHTHSEVHTDHVGYVLSLSDEPLSPSYTDISYFGDYTFKELVDVDTRLYPLVVGTVFPFDYRNGLMIARGYDEPSFLLGTSGAASRVFVDEELFAGMVEEFKRSLASHKARAAASLPPGVG